MAFSLLFAVVDVQGVRPTYFTRNVICSGLLELAATQPERLASHKISAGEARKRAEVFLRDTLGHFSAHAGSRDPRVRAHGHPAIHFPPKALPRRLSRLVEFFRQIENGEREPDLGVAFEVRDENILPFLDSFEQALLSLQRIENYANHAREPTGRPSHWKSAARNMFRAGVFFAPALTWAYLVGGLPLHYPIEASLVLLGGSLWYEEFLRDRWRTDRGFSRQLVRTRSLVSMPKEGHWLYFGANGKTADGDWLDPKTYSTLPASARWELKGSPLHNRPAGADWISFADADLAKRVALQIAKESPNPPTRALRWVRDRVWRIPPLPSAVIQLDMLLHVGSNGAVLTLWQRVHAKSEED